MANKLKKILLVGLLSLVYFSTYSQERTVGIIGIQSVMVGDQELYVQQLFDLSDVDCVEFKWTAVGGTIIGRDDLPTFPSSGSLDISIKGCSVSPVLSLNCFLGTITAHLPVSSGYGWADGTPEQTRIVNNGDELALTCGQVLLRSANSAPANCECEDTITFIVEISSLANDCFDCPDGIIETTCSPQPFEPQN